MKDAIQDLATITTIPPYTLQMLMNKLAEIIAYEVKESKIEKDSYCEIGLSFGTLIISLINDEVKFKFIPSNKLSELIVEALTKEDFQLIQNAENSLRKKILNTYKDLF